MSTPPYSSECDGYTMMCPVFSHCITCPHVSGLILQPHLSRGLCILSPWIIEQRGSIHSSVVQLHILKAHFCPRQLVVNSASYWIITHHKAAALFCAVISVPTDPVAVGLCWQGCSQDHLRQTGPVSMDCLSTLLFTRDRAEFVSA